MPPLPTHGRVLPVQLAEAGQPSYKFDLDRWDPAYFERLRAFVTMAQTLDIVVEVAFFNGMYKDCWPLMPFYHGNNLQGVPAGDYLLEWIHPPTGGVRNTEPRSHAGGEFAVRTPVFTNDVALRMKRGRLPNP